MTGKQEEIAAAMHWYQSVNFKAFLMACDKRPDGSYLIPPDLADGVIASMETSFNELSSDDREVLLRFARRVESCL